MRALGRIRFLWALIVVGLSAAPWRSPALAETFETKARFAILMEASTGAILFQKAADEPMAPAAMAEVMTSAVVFDAIRSGKLHRDDRFQVSDNAWRKGGAPSGNSTMFAASKSSIAVSDLIRGMVIQSGNDACIVLAEGIAGSEAAFVDQMNAMAKKIGLAHSVFRNATGLPDPEQKVTARDLAILAKYVIDQFPDDYKIYSEKEFAWNKIKQQNRNPLLDMNIGADGMKTGFTQESGYGLIGTAVRDGGRLIVVVNGTRSERERSDEARKLLEWGFRSFKRVSLFGDGAPVAEASVFGGEKATVGLRPKGPVDVMLPTGPLSQVTVRVAYQGPLPAPVPAGSEAGSLTILVGGEVTSTVPLFTVEAVGKGDFKTRAAAGLRELLIGWW